MGLGNAATPLGLKAMKSMQKDNKGKNRLSNSKGLKSTSISDIIAKLSLE